MTATVFDAPTQDTRPPTLEMRGISKTFPGTKALNNVQLKAWGGEIQSLMGENGAGKSTLMKVLSGAYHADAGGQILIDGKVVDITNPHVAREHGISIIYQELSLLPNLSVAENIYFGREPSKGGMIDRRTMKESCRGVLQRLGATFGPETIVATAFHRRAPACRNRPRAPFRIQDPGDGRADDHAVVQGNRPSVRPDAAASRRRAGDHLHQPPHGRGLRAVRPGVGAARRDLCRHAGQGRHLRREAGQDDGRPRSQHLLQARPRRQGGPRQGPADAGGRRRHRRRQAGPSLQLHALCRRGARPRRAGRIGPHRTGAADLRRRSQDRRHHQDRRQGSQHPHPQGRARCRHHLPDRGPQAPGPVPRHVGQGQRQLQRDRPGCARRRRAQPAQGGRAGEKLHRRPEDPGRERRPSASAPCRAATSRRCCWPAGWKPSRR